MTPTHAELGARRARERSFWVAHFSHDLLHRFWCHFWRPWGPPKAPRQTWGAQKKPFRRKGPEKHVDFFTFFGKMPEVAEKVKIAPTLMRERRFQGPGGSQHEPLGPQRPQKRVPRSTKNKKSAKWPREKRSERASGKRAKNNPQKCQKEAPIWVPKNVQNPQKYQKISKQTKKSEQSRRCSLLRPLRVPNRAPRSIFESILVPFGVDFRAMFVPFLSQIWRQ